MKPDDKALLLDTAERCIRYRSSIANRSARPTAEELLRLKQNLDASLPERGISATEVIAMLDANGSPATMASTGGRYLGYVVGGSWPVAVAANWLATAWDQNAALVDMSPAAAHFDELALKWLRQALRLPSNATGGLATGATAANIVALASARTYLLGKAGWDVEANGLFGAPELQVIVSDCVHDSINKALMVLGLGRDRVTYMPTDTEGRVCLDTLPSMSERSIVCVQAGCLQTGAFDPIGEIARRAHDAGAWVHVDGAFGLWARATATLDWLTEGIESADSWAVDAHKWLNVPYDSGAVFTVHDQATRTAMAAWSPLLQDERQPAAYTLEQSRRARGVDIWATLAHLGREGVSQLIDQTCQRAREIAEACRALGLDVANEVVLNQILVSAGGDARTAAMLQSIHEDGCIACSEALWKGRRYLRLSVSSCETQQKDIESTVRALQRARDRSPT